MAKLAMKQKVKEMTKDIQKYLEEETVRLYESGGIDTESYLQDFCLSKILLHVALLNCAYKYKPLSKEFEKDIENLKHF